MTLDLTNKTFRYVVHGDGTVLYTANCDGKAQHLSGRDVSSKERLEADLASYTEAYIAGIQSQQASIGEDLNVDKPQSSGA